MSSGQSKIDGLVKKLPAAIDSGLTAVVNWTKAYADAETNQADCRAREVCETLKAAGYAAHEHTGDQFIKGDKYSMGRFIVGQLIGCLEDDGSLPNACSFFPDQYNDMPGEPVAPPPKVPQPISVMRPIRLKFAP